MRFVKRHDVRRTDDYWFEIDEYRRGEDQLLLVHLRFFNWTPSVLKQVIREFRLFRTIVKVPLFGCPQEVSPTWFKFMSKMGYRFHENILCDDGVIRPLYIHTI